MWDSDKVGADDFLGNVMLPVAGHQETTYQGWFSLTRGTLVFASLARGLSDGRFW